MKIENENANQTHPNIFNWPPNLTKQPTNIINPMRGILNLNL